MGAALGEDLLDAVFLAEGLAPPDVLDREPVHLRDPLRVLGDRTGETLDELLEVGELQTTPGQLPRKGLGVANVGERARDEDTVGAGQHAADTGSVAIGEHGNLASRYME